MNATVAEYHWDDREKMEQDYRYLMDLYRQMLPRLADLLNHLHGIRRQARYWEIIVGPWFFRFLSAIFDRWFMINKCCSSHANLQCRMVARPSGFPVARSTAEFVQESLADPWNDYLAGLICKQQGIPVHEVVSPGTFALKAEKKTASPPGRVLKNLFYRLFFFLSKGDQVCLVNSYLPFSAAVQLQAMTFQVPKLMNFNWFPLRQNVIPRSGKWGHLYEGKNEFCRLIDSVFWAQLPTIFFEDFQGCREQLVHKGIQGKPDIIFTSEAHCFNDNFKIWAAEKTNQGAKLIIGQHGGFYGVAKWGADEDREIPVADFYVTWGWRANGQKTIPLGCFPFKKKFPGFNPKGKLCLVQNAVYRYAYIGASLPQTTGQWLRYFREQIKFCQQLMPTIFARLRVRLMPGHELHEETLRWNDTFPGVQFERNRKKLIQLAPHYRLAVLTYQDTPLNELLFYNFPCIAFWNPNMWEIRDSALPIFKELEEAEILHRDPQSAAGMVNKIWDSVGDWWHAPRTQAARKSFCERFAKDPQGITQKLKTLFTQVAEKP